MTRVTDPQGRVFFLDDQRLQHALENHGFLIGFGVIADVVQSPDDMGRPRGTYGVTEE